MSDWVAEARERAERATPGPWRTSMTGYSVKADDSIVASVQGGAEAPPKVFDRWIDDSSFIAASRTDLPRALDVIQAADSLEQAVEAALAYMAQTKPAGLPPLDYVTYSQLTAALAVFQEARR